MNSEKRQIILLGICGGIAATKATDVASRLKKAGNDVHVIMSAAAQKFVTPLTFASLTGNPVLESLFPASPTGAGEKNFPHLYPATRAEIFVLLPATADMIAKIAHGLGDDIVSTSALSLPPACRKFFCPAMNVEMWRQPVVQENVRALEARSWTRIGPDSGELACGMTGEGRMTEPAEIVSRLFAVPAPTGTVNLRGKTVLIVSGPTREHFDPVRFIGNASSGKMGRALADEAVAAGAIVKFVTGPVEPVNLPDESGVAIQRVTSAEEMLAAAQKNFPQADVVIYAAAVADYKPAEYSEGKLPKKSRGHALKLEPTPDVAATLNAAKNSGQVCIGFALQTDDGEAQARAKLKKKNFDGIVLNALDAMGGDSGSYRFISARSKSGFTEWGHLTKRDCAKRILAEAAGMFL